MRIALSLPLAVLPLKSPWFIVLYSLAGLTDILDGFLARKTGTASDFGARLDSIADLVFYSIMMVRILPLLWLKLPRTIWFAVGAALIVRLAAYCAAAIKYRRFAALHTYLNKLTGALLFILAYVMIYSECRGYAWLVAGVALLASAEELAVHIASDEYRPDKKSIFIRPDSEENKEK